MAGRRLGTLVGCLAKTKRILLAVDHPAARAVFLPWGWKIGARALLSALFGQRYALSLRARHFARRHRFDAAACVVIDPVNGARKFERSLLQQKRKALVGMRPINQR